LKFLYYKRPGSNFSSDIEIASDSFSLTNLYLQQEKQIFVSFLSSEYKTTYLLFVIILAILVILFVLTTVYLIWRQQKHKKNIPKGPGIAMIDITQNEPRQEMATLLEKIPTLTAMPSNTEPEYQHEGMGFESGYVNAEAYI
jgi:hypothetical protein